MPVRRASERPGVPLLDYLATSIRRKLAAALLAAIALATLLSAIGSIWRETEHHFRARRDASLAIAHTLSVSVAQAVERRDLLELRTRTNAIRGIKGIRYVTIMDAAGRRLHDIGTGVIVGPAAAPLRANQEIGLFSSVRLGTYLVSVPVVSGGTTVGSIAMIIDLSELRSTLVDSAIAALLSGLAAAILGMLVAFRLHAAITNPITALTRATEEVRQAADYSRPVERTTSDETGRLVDTFNAMLEVIRSRDDALRRQRDGLADEVRARTRDLHAAKEEAERANAAKSDFLATMSHEIRTPMNGMLVMAELLAAESLPPRARRNCDVILKSGRVLLSLINDILDLSKIEAGQLQLEQIPCDPAAVVEDVVQLFAERAQTRGLEIACRIAPDVPTSIIGDPLRLQQVLSNLVNNALKFTETGGVLVEATVDKSGVAPRLQFAVRDSGIGIPADRIASLFDAFTQAEASTSRRFGGTGIGLTICKRLATAMGGDIGVASVVGQGSTFALVLPMAAAGAGAPASAAADVLAGPVAVAMEPGPARDAIAMAIADLGLEVATSTEAGAKALVTDADKPRDLVAAATGGEAIPVLSVARFGRPAADTAHAGASEIPVPAGGRQTRDMIARAVRGLPLARATPVDTGHLRQPQSFAGCRVLVVDDNPVNLEVLGEALRRFGIDPVCHETALAAIAAHAAAPFDLIYMDGSMPEIDGFEATRRIRAAEAASGASPVPIVAVTAHVIGVGAQTWREAGFSDHMTKPFTLEAVRASLVRWLGDRAATLVGTGASVSAETAGTTAPASPLLDAAVLATIRQIRTPGSTLAARVLGLFKQHAPRLLKNLEQAPSDDVHAAGQAAHALKSLCRNIGALQAGNLCEVIEADAADGRAPDPAALATLAAVLAATIAALDEELREAA